MQYGPEGVVMKGQHGESNRETEPRNHTIVKAAFAMKRSERGYTLTELLIVVAVIGIALGVSIINVIPALRAARVEEAFQTTLMQVRRARQSAVDERRIYILSFVLPGTMTVQRIELDGTITFLNQSVLPAGVTFRAETGIPTDPAQTPDGFGDGSVAVDFNGGDSVFFQADGSAEDALGRVTNGVVYMAREGSLETSRAISVLGTTGRIKGWKLLNLDGSTLGWR
jgi:prepilin-type N-terminal cleavage/methylation domain-containing protein